ncbi:MAG: N-acetylmuramoyl-L-alanine amidase [Blastocatellia bacterium]
MKPALIILAVLSLLLGAFALGHNPLSHAWQTTAPESAASPVVAAAAQEPPQTRAAQAPPQIRSASLDISFRGPALAVESAQDATLTPRGYVIAPGRQNAVITFDPVAVTMSDPEPFLALSAQWQAVAADDALMTISVRGAADGANWGEWLLSTLDGDPRARAGLFFLPAATRQIQYRVELGRDPRGETPTISQMNFRFISPGATPGWMYQQMLDRPAFDAPAGRYRANASALNGAFPKPGLVSRIAWGCPDGDRQHRGAPSYTNVSHLIVHHTATSNESTDWSAVVRSIWNFHVFTNGWSDLGYNYLIDPNGVIYEGRAGGDNVIGAHFSCANSGTMGTSMLGTYTTSVPTAKAVSSLRFVLAWKADQRGLDPLGIAYHGGTQLQLKNISGHRDSDGAPPPACPGTECPGTALYATLPAIRNEVKTLVDPANDFALTTDTPARGVNVGEAATISVNTATTRGAAQNIRLEASGLPPGVTAAFSPAELSTGGATTLTINAGAGAPGGVYPIAITGYGSTVRALTVNLAIAGTVTTVSAASYRGPLLARGAIAAAFGAGLGARAESALTQPLPTTLGGVMVKVRDSQNAERDAPLFFVSPTQINYLVPPESATGAASVTVTSNGAVTARGTIQIAAVAPALFSANASGIGVAIGSALRVKADQTQTYEAIAQYDTARAAFVPAPVALRAGEQVFLILYGVGIRNCASQDAVRARIGGVDAAVYFAGQQGGFAGLDQLNILLPEILTGRGDVDIAVTVDGQAANVVQVNVR